MTQYILDTDRVTLLQQLHPVVTQRVDTINPENIGVTVVTVEEQLRGWLDAIRQASSSSQPERLIWAYMGRRDAFKFINSLYLVNFGQEAYIRYAELRRQSIRIGTQDLLIAAIALSRNSIFVTRNPRDFARLLGLIFEDWTI